MTDFVKDLYEAITEDESQLLEDIANVWREIKTLPNVVVDFINALNVCQKIMLERSLRFSSFTHNHHNYISSACGLFLCLGKTSLKMNSLVSAAAVAMDQRPNH